MGDEPHAAQRLHAEIPTRGAAPGGRRAGAGGVWRVEVGGFSAFCGAEERGQRASQTARPTALQLHQFERCPAKEPERARQRLQQFEMIVAFADEEFDGLAGGFHRGGKIARLALEFRRLQRPVGNDDRAIEPVDMALRAQLLLDLIGELDVVRSRREPNRLVPEESSASLTMSLGRSKSRCQSVVTTQPPRCPPEEWPQT